MDVHLRDGLTIGSASGSVPAERRFSSVKCAGAILITAIATVSCGEDAPVPFHQPPADAVFSETIRQVVVEVDYADGATPFTGGAGSLQDVWSITRENLAALFAGSDKTLVVPSTLSEMANVGGATGPFDSTRILDIAVQHRKVFSSEDSVSLYVLFLDGYYEVGGAIDDTVLGAALAGTGVIAMFVPVIESAGRPFETTSVPLTEQATLVHEIGHSFGLVNVGLPMVSDHEDPNHRSHCTNSRCVMYWANEGAAGLDQFLSGSVDAGNVVLFDKACLADARAAALPGDAGADAAGTLAAFRDAGLAGF